VLTHVSRQLQAWLIFNVSLSTLVNALLSPYSSQISSLGFASAFQHDDGFEGGLGRADLVKRKNRAQAFAASFPAKDLVLAVEALARLAFGIGSLKTERSGFQRGRTRAACLFFFAMLQRANQALEPTTTAVTDRAVARSAPAAVAAHH
jgi:hypothetical protein